MRPIVGALILLGVGGWILFNSLLLGQSRDCGLTLSGQLLSMDGQFPLAYATVHIPEVDMGAVTDSTGNFSIDNLCPGDYTLVCTHPQCEYAEFHHHLEDHPHDLTLTLTTQEYELDAVMIKGIKVADAPTQTTSMVVGQELFQGQTATLADALTAVPGINTLKTGPTIVKPIIHGLHSNRILILNNGIRQEGQQWGSEHAPEIDPFIAKRLTVLKGAAAVRYGSGAMAGVVLVEPGALPDSGGVHGTLTLAGHSNGRVGIVSGNLEGRLRSAWAWRVQGTLKQGGNLHTPDYYLANTGVRERNVSATLGYQTFPRGISFYYSRFATQLGILSAAHVGSRRDLEAAFQATRPAGADEAVFSYQIGRPYQSVNHNLAKVQAYQRVGDWGKLSATYAFQYNDRKEFDSHSPIGSDLPPGAPQLDFRISTHTVEGLLEHQWGQSWSGTVGAFGLYQDNALEGRPFIPNFVSVGGEVFAIERWKAPGDWLELEAGLRYDYRYLHSARREAAEVIYEIRRFHNVSGTIGANLDLSQALALHVNLGSSWRPPHVNELFSDGLHHGAATVEKGNPNLDAEQALKGIATLQYAANGRLSGELSVFYHHFLNFIYRRPDGLDRTIRGTFPKLVYDQTPARLMGADLSLQYRWENGLALSGKGSWLQADNLADGQPLIFMPANWGELGVAYQLKGTSRLDAPQTRLSVRHITQQNRVPVSEDPEANDWLPPPPAYTLLNLDLSTALLFGSQKVNLGLRIENLLNTRYRAYLDRFRYFADAPGRNVSLRVDFLF